MAGGDKFILHIENDHARGKVFRVTPARDRARPSHNPVWPRLGY